VDACSASEISPPDAVEWLSVRLWWSDIRWKFRKPAPPSNSYSQPASPQVQMNWAAQLAKTKAAKEPLCISLPPRWISVYAVQLGNWKSLNIFKMWVCPKIIRAHSNPVGWPSFSLFRLLSWSVRLGISTFFGQSLGQSSIAAYMPHYIIWHRNSRIELPINMINRVIKNI
jgi:hypothetical protein